MGCGYLLRKSTTPQVLLIHVSLISMQAGDGSRQPTELELNLATEQGKAFWGHVSAHKFA